MTARQIDPLRPNRYSLARGRAQRHSDFIDLICTNFHSCGLRYPVDRLREYADEYYADPALSSYAPDPRGSPAIPPARRS